MGQLTCELCGSTNLVKEGGVFVCKKCGAKYSVEDAKRLVAESSPNTEKKGVSKKVEEIKARARAAAEAAKKAAKNEMRVTVVSEFDPDTVGALNDSRIINNYACQGFSAFIEEYKKIEHPEKKELDTLIDNAKECLGLFQKAALVDPQDHLADLLIYNNCQELVRTMEDLRYWEKDDKGEWKKHPFGPSAGELKIAGSKDSWESLARNHQDYVEMAWLESNEDTMAERRELAEKVQTVQAQLGELKEEKKGLGIGANIPIISKLVNPDAKEMEARMKPVREELNALERQIRDIDRLKTDWVEGQLKYLANSYIRLAF